MTTTNFHPDVAKKVLDAWGASKGRTIQGEDAKQGILGLLVKAELHAADKGFAVALTDGSSTLGYLIGGATDKARTLAAQGNQDAIAYMAAQDAATRAQAEILAAPATGNAEASSYDLAPTDYENAAFPIAALVVIAVVAVAAAVAAVAWAYSTKVTVEAQTQARIALVNQALDAASSADPNVRATVPALLGMAAKAVPTTPSAADAIPWVPLLIVGGLIIGGKLVWDHVGK